VARATTLGRRLVLPRPNPAATRSLVCLSYCGGGTAPFRAWAGVLPADVELAIVCYPGRESRYGEPFCRDWAALAEDTMAALALLGPRPYALFGHSMGSVLAFDVTAALEQRGGHAPTALIVSGGDAPSRYAAQRAKPPTAADSDEQLVAWLRDTGQVDAEVLGDADLRSIAVDLLRADLVAAETYRYTPGVTVSAPVHLLYGADEDEPAADVTARWRLLARGPFQADVLAGGHFYTPAAWASLPRLMSVPVAEPATVD
jgi:surfactin synthase thioesterase subunit